MKAGFASVLVLTLLGACAPSLRPPPSDEALRAAYARAVADARDVEPGEIDKDLVWVGTENPQLVWSPDKHRVLAVTWTSWDGYDQAVGRAMPLGQEVWVTLAPELRERCRALPATTDRALRLEQLLGLPPGNGKTRFVELWVDPRDMFRPAPDPEVNDSQADLDFPVSGRMAVAERHIGWFNKLKESSYGPKGYPWTRLGYTYDWGNPASEVGLSEFVVEKGAASGGRGCPH